MKRAFVVAVLILVAAAVALADKGGLLRIAPDSLVKGWALVKDSTVYAKGEGLTQIYDGGYQVYVKAGVVEALRRMYSRGNIYAEVTVHRMKSAKAGRAFLDDRYRMETNKAAPKDRSFYRFIVSGNGSTTGYLAKKTWFVTVVAYDSSAASRKTVSAFLTAIEKRTNS